MNLYPWAHRHGVSLAALEDLKHELGLAGPVLPFDVVDPTPRTEAQVTATVRLEAARLGITLWRNNVGAYYDDNGNYVRYGLANDTKAMNETNKSSDLVGIKPGGQFICREVKASDWTFTGTAHEEAQLNFINYVQSMGGDASFTVGKGSFG